MGSDGQMTGGDGGKASGPGGACAVNKLEGARVEELGDES